MPLFNVIFIFSGRLFIYVMLPKSVVEILVFLVEVLNFIKQIIEGTQTVLLAIFIQTEKQRQGS